MEVRILKKEDQLDLYKLETIAFVGSMDVDEAKRRYAEEPDGNWNYTWGCFNDAGKLSAAVINNPFHCWYEGQKVAMGGVGGVASLPEGRTKGAVRAIFRAIFADMRAKGEFLSTLYPFSHSYYRQYGYEVCNMPNRVVFPVVALKKFRQTMEARMHLTGEPIDDFKTVYDRFAQAYNLATARDEFSWKWTLGGDPYKDRKYRYLLYEDGQPRAYVNFRPGDPKQPGAGHMAVVEQMAFDGAEALYNILGFLSKLSAQYGHVQMTLPGDIDLSVLLDEPYECECTRAFSGMARLVDVQRALELLRAPQGEGECAIRVEDEFLPENSGCYRLRYADGALSAEKGEFEADLCLSEQTLCQLCLGALSMDQARWKQDVILKGKNPALWALFPGKKVFLTNGF